MPAEDGQLYMLQGGDGDAAEADGWATPVPASRVITDAIAATTDLEPDSIGSLDTYVDCAELRAVLGHGGEAALTFAVEGHDVTVDSDGDVTVA